MRKVLLVTAALVALQTAASAQIVSGGSSGSGPSGGDVNLTEIDGTAASVGNGATDAGTLRVTLSNDSTGTVAVPGVATAANQTTGNSSLSTIAAAVGSPIPAGTAAIGSVAIIPTTTSGSTPAGYVSTASTNATNVKNGAGTVTALNFINTTQTIGYVRMYNLSSTPTCNSATGFVRSWPVPPASASGLAGGIAVNLGATGTAFSTGIGFCATGGGTSTDNTNAPAGIYINIDYR